MLVSPRPIVNAQTKVEYHSVGHYSVRPDYFTLAKIPPENIVCYLLTLIYKSTAVLEKKRRQLGAFDVVAFRASFLREVTVECLQVKPNQALNTDGLGQRTFGASPEPAG